MLIYENVLTVRDHLIFLYGRCPILHEIQKSKTFHKEDFVSTKTNNIQGAAFHLFLPLCAFR